LILTRVSTVMQEDRFSHAAQERQVREKLIVPLGLYVADEIKHVIHDTYSGLEYRYREALERILEMAERGEFDVLCMDVLDRGLGRKALARELYRMQLREFGVRVLTTDPTDHADDDSLEGQIMRFHKGVKAEQEITDFVRRTRDGKREKALGNEEKGRPGQIVGNGVRLYGYKYVRSEKGTPINFTPNLDVIFVEEDGTKWTEVTVVVFVIESAANGVSTHQIAAILNTKGIPTPFITKGHRKRRNMKEEPVWQRNTIGNMIKDTAYYGEYRQFKHASIGRIPGRRVPGVRRTTEDEQVVIRIPALVTKELSEKANRRVGANKQLATRNNKTSRECLLQGGFAKCAYCGRSCRINRVIHTNTAGEDVAGFYYDCSKPHLKGGGKCGGCSIQVDILDAAVTEKIIEIIRDPSEVDQKIRKLQADNSVSKHKQRKLRDLNNIVRDQDAYRANLAVEMRKKTFSERTAAFLNAQINILEQEEQQARKELGDEQRVQEQHEKLEQRFAEFHRQCEEWREKLDDPEFTFPFAFLSEARLFFGITATVWRIGRLPRHELHTDPPEIMELFLNLWNMTK